MGLFSKIKKIGKKIIRSPISQAISPFIPGVGAITQRSVAESLISRKRGGVTLQTPGGLPGPTQPRFLNQPVGPGQGGTGVVLGRTPGISGRLGFSTPGIDRARSSQFISRRPNLGTLDLLGVTPPGGGAGMSIATFARGAGGALARTVGGGRGIVRTTTGRISSIVMPSGQRFSRKNAASLIRRVGFEAAALALGIGAIEAAEILLADNQAAKRRRSRGVSGADMRCATRTMRRVKSLACQLGIKSTAPRRRTCATR